MHFDLKEAVAVLQRTPQTLEHFLTGLPDGWLQCREGEETWNISEVIEHLIEAEKHNWLPRLEFILKEGESKPFPAFDRYAHLKKAQRSMGEKLLEFKAIRTRNLARLQALVDQEDQLEVTGAHPAFGVVKVKELLATWAVHDLTHMAQIVRVMAERYRADVGPWTAYLGILNRQ